MRLELQTAINQFLFQLLNILHCLILLAVVVAVCRLKVLCILVFILLVHVLFIGQIMFLVIGEVPMEIHIIREILFV